MQQDTTTTPVLATHDLGKRFGTLWAVRGIQLALQPGSITGLLGPNGAGKTTLIRLCAGLLRPDAGHVSVAGEQQTPANLHARARLGVVSVDAPLTGELTVMHMLRLQGVLYGLYGAHLRAACARAVDEFCLGEFQHRRISVLSTGMRQRAAIASAMLHQPELLLLDEPTVGLDPDVRRHIWDCLRAVAQRGVAILFTTHYLEEAARLCQLVHLIVRGTVVMSIAPAEMDGSAERFEREYLRIVQQETGA